jgi:hypothetical protein
MLVIKITTPNKNKVTAYEAKNLRGTGQVMYREITITQVINDIKKHRKNARTEKRCFILYWGHIHKVQNN